MLSKHDQVHYALKKEARAQETRIKHIAKIARKQCTITWHQEEAMRILDLRKIEYVREKRIFHHDSFYLVDIYLPEWNMCVEIDGASHDLPEIQEKDRIRDTYLREQGYWVFRIKNEDIRYFWKHLRSAIGYSKFVLKKYWEYKKPQKR